MNRLRVLTLAIAVVGILCFFAIFWLLIATPVSQWESLPLTALGAIAASCVAGLAALAVSETVDQRRRAEVHGSLRNHRERVYETVLQQLLSIFIGGRPIAEVAMMRTAVAVWGSANVVQLLKDWNSTVSPIIDRNPGGTVVLTPREKVTLLPKLGELAIAMRADLTDVGDPVGDPSAEQIAAMLFDDYEKTIGELSKDGGDTED